LLGKAIKEEAVLSASFSRLYIMVENEKINIRNYKKALDKREKI